MDPTTVLGTKSLSPAGAQCRLRSKIQLSIGHMTYYDRKSELCTSNEIQQAVNC